jgi:hypothetical protein
MDPVTLIVAALATGATLGLRDTTTAAVHDTYPSFKSSCASGSVAEQMVTWC